jgi:hypothetical protein
MKKVMKYEEAEKLEEAIKQVNKISSNSVLADVTPSMRVFAEEYSLWIITQGQKYINALSPKFTTRSSMDIFLESYYGKGWMG